MTQEKEEKSGEEKIYWEWWNLQEGVVLPLLFPYPFKTENERLKAFAEQKKSLRDQSKASVNAKKRGSK